jgi:polygalacturonase
VNDPQLTGGTVEDFENISTGNYTTLSSGNVIFSVYDYGELSVSMGLAGQYNTTGLAYLDNKSDGPDIIRFDFTQPVDAFGFNFGASDIVWTLTAYNSADMQLDQITISALHGANNGEYFGLNAPGISYALLSASANND